jgi:hypothetical protein
MENKTMDEEDVAFNEWWCKWEQFFIKHDYMTKEIACSGWMAGVRYEKTKEAMETKSDMDKKTGNKNKGKQEDI